VAVVGFQPEFDVKRGLWYCDIEMAVADKLGDPYFPFVQLALARYQRHCIQGLELSKVVIADYIQVAPDRTATVNQTTGQLTIKLASTRWQRS
jgi:hypothetical protein